MSLINDWRNRMTFFFLFFGSTQHQEVQEFIKHATQPTVKLIFMGKDVLFLQNVENLRCFSKFLLV